MAKAKTTKTKEKKPAMYQAPITKEEKKAALDRAL